MRRKDEEKKRRRGEENQRWKLDFAPNSRKRKSA